ncbi:MAG: TspO/MBR family protein [Pyrinomonadaceae bacterium]
MNDRIRQIFVVLATVGVIAVNYLAASGRINNVTPEVISDKYPTILTPAGYAFTIWSLIYLGLIGFSIFQALPSKADNPRLRPIRTVYILSCVANCAWIYLWHYELIPVALAVMFLLLGTLALINVKLRDAPTNPEILLAKIPFSIYFGWVTVATILNASIALVYLGVKTSDQTTQILGAILIAVATGLGVFLRFKLNLLAYPVAVAWALTAIAVAHGGETIIVVSSAIAVIILLLTALSGFLTAGKKAV